MNFFRFRGVTCFPTPKSSRTAPFPKLCWADRNQVWDLMCVKDAKYVRSLSYLDRHPSLEPRMRAILLDWLTEVFFFILVHFFIRNDNVFQNYSYKNFENCYGGLQGRES